jgi:hypothetical protein
MVHEVLSQASQVGMTEASAPLMKSGAWFDANAGRVQWAPWELAKLAHYVFNQDVTVAQASFVASVRDNQGASVSELVYALALLQHHREMPWHRCHREVPAAVEVESQMEKRLVSLLENLSLDKVSFKSDDFSREAVGFVPARSVLLGDTSLVLRHMKEPPVALIKKIERRLLDDLEEGRLWSPLDAALVIHALKPTIIADLEAEKDSKTKPVQVVDAKGKALGMAEPIAAGYLGSFAAADLAGKDLSKIEIRVPAENLTFVGDLTVTTPFSDVQQGGQGVSITRTLLRVVPGGVEALAPDASLALGDVIVSKLVVKRDEGTGWWTNRSPSDWFVIEDGIPALAEGIDDDRTYLADAKLVSRDATWWSEVKETLRYPDRTERVTRLGTGATMTSYSVWRVAYQGEAVIPPARVVNMYLKGLEGNTTSQRVRVGVP